MENLEDKIEVQEYQNYINEVSKEMPKQLTKYIKYILGIAVPVSLLIAPPVTVALISGLALTSTYVHSKLITDERIAEARLDECHHNQQMDILNKIYSELQER